MKLWDKAVVLLIGAAVFVSGCTPKSEKNISESTSAGITKAAYSSKTEEIDAFLTENIPRTAFPSMSVTIVDKNDVLMSKSYGISGMEKKTHAVGSVSKSFTALCIMQLAEQGKLSLSAPLSLYLPSVTDASKITILQLLNHTSGLGEHQNAGNCHIVGVQGKHVYANVNYSLLGEVVEAVSGMSFEDYVTANVIKPLGMDSTFANPSEAVNKGLARGHSNWFGLKIPTSIQYSSSKNAWITVPAGYICSSSSDLGRYLQMYLRGGEGIISSDGIHSMFYDSVYVEDDIPYSYGMGWNVIKDTLSEPVIYHTGLVETGMACIYILPESGIGVSFTVNANDYLIGTDLADRVGWAVIEILTGDKHGEIGEHEYLLRHLMFDAIYLAVLAVAVLSFVKVRSGKTNTAVLILLHLILPVLLLILLPVFLKTPLWVAKAFVPDMFTVIVVSAALLFISGIARVVFRKKKKAFEKV